MVSAKIVLLVFAFVLFVLAAIPLGPSDRLTGAGLACLTAAYLFG